MKKFVILLAFIPLISFAKNGSNTYELKDEALEIFERGCINDKDSFTRNHNCKLAEMQRKKNNIVSRY